MRKLLSFSLLLCTACTGKAQEFTVHDNGLIYPDTTVGQLKHIVDSLNLKFKACDLSRIYYSLKQARGHYVYLNYGKVADAAKDMDRNIALEHFRAKYKPTITEGLVVCYPPGANENTVTGYELRLSPSGDNDNWNASVETNAAALGKPVKGHWIYHYSKPDQYDKAGTLRAFYFVDELAAKPIPLSLARMVQYSDCLVDTAVSVFSEKAQRTGGWYFDEEKKEHEKASKADEFIAYVHKATGYPDQKGKTDEEWWKEYQAWDSLHVEMIDRQLQHTAAFKTKLKEAVDDALASGSAEAALEFYAGRYYSRKAQLSLMRNRVVVGRCSQDESPRYHALNIALLSAETVSWEVFLRAHLDIMNDRFERTTDGSYAWGKRQTYIKELEVLDINVPDLLFGISLRVGNPSKGHYYGSIGRLGRSMAETQAPNVIEQRMLDMIADPALDDYNRILMYYLFRNYNHYLKDKAHRVRNRDRLKRAVQTFPSYLVAQYPVKEERPED